MKRQLLDILCRTEIRADLYLSEESSAQDEIERGILTCRFRNRVFPIVNHVPRFVLSENYADNFGFQWNRFRQTPLDSDSGVPISRDRLMLTLGLKGEELTCKHVLDVGCGAGTFCGGGPVQRRKGGRARLLDRRGRSMGQPRASSRSGRSAGRHLQITLQAGLVRPRLLPRSPSEDAGRQTVIYGAGRAPEAERTPRGRRLTELAQRTEASNWSRSVNASPQMYSQWCSKYGRGNFSAER